MESRSVDLQEQLSQHLTRGKPLHCSDDGRRAVATLTALSHETRKVGGNNLFPRQTPASRATHDPHNLSEDA